MSETERRLTALETTLSEFMGRQYAVESVLHALLPVTPNMAEYIEKVRSITERAEPQMETSTPTECQLELAKLTRSAELAQLDEWLLVIRSLQAHVEKTSD